MTNMREAAHITLRTSFGLALLFVGLAHYMAIAPFVESVSAGLGPLTFLGTIWGYALPALLCIGGALFALGMSLELGAWAAGVALGSIPAGLMLKAIMTGVPITELMPGAMNAFVWLVVYALILMTHEQQHRTS